MSLNATQISSLHALARSGENKVRCAEVLEVQWSSAVTRYYSWTNYGEIAGYQNIPFGPIEARITNEPFRQFEKNPDLRTDTIPIVFDDIADKDTGVKPITPYFKRYGTVRCILWYYWPDVDGTEEVWHGQLQKPNIYGYAQINTVATNGFWSRERNIPHSMRPPDLCRYHDKFALPTADMVLTAGCGYDRHLSGTVGNLNGSDPYTACNGDVASCIARGMTTTGRDGHYGGYSTDASATVSDGNSGHIAISRGNTSSNTRPIPVVAGTKHLRGLNRLLSRPEPNQNNPDRGFFAGVWEVSEGTVRNIRNIKVNEKLIEQMHLDIRHGHRGQPAVANYNAGGTISNFSGVAHFSARKGWTNPLYEQHQNAQAECDCDGYDMVAVWSTTESGAGLLGVYYFNDDFTEEHGRRIDHNINYPSQSFAPMFGLDTSLFSIAWSGSITFPFSETFTFTAEHDTSCELVINGSTIINEATEGTHTGTFAATAGTAYTFELNFRHILDVGFNPWAMILQWASPSVAFEVVPNSAFSHGTNAATYARQWSDDRVWWILEQYTNQRFGLGYDPTRATTADWRTASTWGLRQVVFTLTTPDGETKTFEHRRTTFGALLEGRSAVDQIVDTCRSGGLSVPFWHNGELTIRPFRAATSAEIASVPVFTDRIVNQTSTTKRRIVHDDGPAIQIEETPDELLTNEITLSFEAADNFDAARPITVDDPNQKRKAGLKLGTDTRETVPMKFAAFGVRHLNEAVKLAYRLLWFGAFDQGGTKNNCRVTFQTPYEFAVDLVRYQIIRIDSDLLDSHGYGDPFAADQTPPSVPEGYGAEFVDDTEITLTLGLSDDIDAPEIVPFEYFRILSMKRVANGRMEITAQAYNVIEYAAFEVESNPNGVIDPPDDTGEDEDGDFEGDGCILLINSVNYDADNQNIVVSARPC